MKRLFIITSVLSVCLIWSAFPLFAAQNQGQGKWQTGYVEPTAKVNLKNQPQAQALTNEQLEARSTSLSRTHFYPQRPLSAQIITNGPMLYPTKGETIEADKFTAQTNNFQQVVNHGLTSNELDPVSDVAEPSIGYSQMKKGFMTYNWGAARSEDGGFNWIKVDPFTTPGIPSGYTFCCDQYVVFDPVYNMHYWMRLVLPNSGGGGALVLGVSPNTTTWTFYTFAESTTRLPDFPKMELSHNYLYITYNEFDNTVPHPYFTQTVVMRLPLLAMAEGEAVSYDYFTQDDWFTIKVAQNYRHNSTMYAASNHPESGAANTVRVFTWDESATDATYAYHDITIDGWGYGSDLNCPCTSGTDPCARSDDRILGAVVSSNAKFPESGKDQLWLAWSSDNYSSYVYPFIYLVQIDVDCWSVLDYDPIYSDTNAFIYPAMSVNGAGDIGMVFDAVGGALTTRFAALLLDGDISGYDGPYTYNTIADGDSCPAIDVWGDFNDIEPWWRNRYQFVAAGHVRTTANGSQPYYVRFTNSAHQPQ